MVPSLVTRRRATIWSINTPRLSGEGLFYRGMLGIFTRHVQAHAVSWL